MNYKKTPILANKKCCFNCLNKKGAICNALQEHTNDANCSFLFTEEDKEKVQKIYDNRPEEVKKLIELYRLYK